jgi:hypothetical protein
MDVKYIFEERPSTPANVLFCSKTNAIISLKPRTAPIYPIEKIIANKTKIYDRLFLLRQEQALGIQDRMVAGSSSFRARKRGAFNGKGQWRDKRTLCANGAHPCPISTLF